MTDHSGLGAGLIDRRTALKTLLGFGVAVLLVYLLGAVIGWDRAIERLREAQVGWVLVACVSTLLCLFAWAKTWQVVLRQIGVFVPYRRLVVTFFAATFANYVTPMGQAGGEPFIAYILSRDTEATFEQALASVVTADLIRMLPFFTVGGAGLGYLLATAGVTARIRPLAIALVVLAVALPLLAVVGWRFRDRVKRGLLYCLAPIARGTDRLSIESARDRIDRLYASIGLIAGSPRGILVAIAFAYVGWIFFALPLYFSGVALGVVVSIPLVCFVVPVTVIAGSVPLPGGIGAIEGTLVVLLPVLAGLTATDALAVTTIYRLTSYWFVIAVGGIAMLGVIRRV
ncbi:YbhN family protein [Natronomonas sp.]|uniref:lysylphosphatidylglycerol synthase transmembrane domain-containing protein n=1 Tax=Natronomonas sp. TaxID=2184060 RepID=UPI003975C0D9